MIYLINVTYVCYNIDYSHEISLLSKQRLLQSKFLLPSTPKTRTSFSIILTKKKEIKQKINKVIRNKK